MNPYPDTIELEDVGMRGDSRVFRTTAPFRFYSKQFGLIIVPKGTYTDGASIPRIFWSILSPFGAYFKAALPHDYLYQVKRTNYTRADADNLLREGMEELGIPLLTRVAIYRAVRLFGWIYWNKRKAS